MANISFLELFFKEEFWLPSNTTWKDRPVDTNAEYGKPGDLLYALPLALVILVVRFVMQSLLFAPLGVYLGLNEGLPKPPESHDELEKAYRQTVRAGRRRLTDDEIVGLAKKSGLTQRQVERWFRKRRKVDQKTTLDKFNETAFRCFFYTFFLLYGLFGLSSRPWVWDTSLCYIGYPFHHIDGTVRWYYTGQLAFYLSLSSTLFFDVKRKDFAEMIVHHIVTVTLMLLSWFTHFTRIGMLVMLVHDWSDPFLEAAKLFKYPKFNKTSDLMFIIFLLTWLVTRLYVFPFKILYSTTVELPKYLPAFPGLYVFNGLLYCLQVLHIIWTYFIFRVLYKLLKEGITADDRSEDESDSDTSGSDNTDRPVKDVSGGPRQYVTERLKADKKKS